MTTATKKKKKKKMNITIRTALKIWMIITLTFTCCVIVCFHIIENQSINKQDDENHSTSSGMMDLHSHYAHDKHRLQQHQRSDTIKTLRDIQQHLNNDNVENISSSEVAHNGKDAAAIAATEAGANVGAHTTNIKRVAALTNPTANIENQSGKINVENTTLIEDTKSVSEGVGSKMHNKNQYNIINNASSSKFDNDDDDDDIRVGDIVYHHYDDNKYGWLIAKVIAIANYSKRIRVLYLEDCTTKGVTNNSTLLKKIHVANATTNKKYIRLMSEFQECEDNDSTNNIIKENTTSKSSTTTETVRPIHKTPLGGHTLAGLNCDRFGGPSEDTANEMVYWRDIPSDEQYITQFSYHQKDEKPKYLLFEVESHGWNNVRMSMETAVVLAIATGRILVLPPTHIWHNKTINDEYLSFDDFYHFDSIIAEHNATRAFEMISVKEFVKREGVTGQLRNKYTGDIEYPPGDGDGYSDDDWLREDYDIWLRNVSYIPTACPYRECVFVVPDKPGNESAKEARELQYQLLDQLQKQNKNTNSSQQQQPQIGVVPVNATPLERLLDIRNLRQKIFVYDDEIQKQKVIHFMYGPQTRLLTHFYTYVLLINWKDDLWIKRFVRDHLRYNDLIQCTSAKIVHALRQISIDNGNPNGEYDSFHIRRGDFERWYHDSFVEHPMELYDNCKDILPLNSTIYVATNERNKTFFDPLRQYYHIYFLDDFMDLITDDMSHIHYLGMIDQCVASKGRIFVGTYVSTFTGYIYRMRGYHAQKERNIVPTGNPNTTIIHDGDMLTTYFSKPRKQRDDMLHYHGVYGALWAREFPHGWRDVDHDAVLAQ